MPIMSGYEMCVRLKANPGTTHIPVIMLTARGHKLSPEDVAQTNIRVLVPKPFSIQDLLQRSAQILEGPGAEPRGSEPGSAAA